MIVITKNGYFERQLTKTAKKIRYKNVYKTTYISIKSALNLKEAYRNGVRLLCRMGLLVKLSKFLNAVCNFWALVVCFFSMHTR